MTLSASFVQVFMQGLRCGFLRFLPRLGGASALTQPKRAQIFGSISVRTNPLAVRLIPPRAGEPPFRKNS